MKPFITRLGALAVGLAVLAACSANRETLPSVSGDSVQNLAAVAAPVSGGAVRHVEITQADIDAGHAVTEFSYKIFPTSAHWGLNATKVFKPADLKYFGGVYMKKATEHDIYVNCPKGNQSCWGDPEGFLTRLGGSMLAKLLKQYTKVNPTAYKFGDATAVAWPNYDHSIYYNNDLFSILHAVVKQTSADGKGNYKTDEYHIFLARGQDTCFDGTTICYSPDNPSTFAFCAYHGAVKFQDLGLVTYSVEPYQNVSTSAGGCVYPNLPKNFDPLTNSTDSTLAHETFESITDTNPNSFSTLGWYNLPYNSEIADLCDSFPMVQKFGNMKLFIQTMYSNKYHGCANGP